MICTSSFLSSGIFSHALNAYSGIKASTCHFSSSNKHLYFRADLNEFDSNFFSFYLCHIFIRLSKNLDNSEKEKSLWT